jgi:hypothetical protein
MPVAVVAPVVVAVLVRGRRFLVWRQCRCR